MELNDLLRGRGFDPKRGLVMRHQPIEPQLRQALPWLASEHPQVFNAYQRAQRPKVEKALGSVEFVVSFIANGPRRALFIGLYAVKGAAAVTLDEFWAMPENIELKAHGMIGPSEEAGRPFPLWFDLQQLDFYEDWKGKLVVDWPPPERVWCRRAHQNSIRVAAILEESALVPKLPDWFEIVFMHNQLAILPSSWKSALSHWRGIYLIVDTSDGRAYVGSAYGSENILGRWLGYAMSGHGDNKLLKQRDPRNFQFSILERVSPDMGEKEVVRLESTWKNRLRTRKPYGLNLN